MAAPHDQNDDNFVMSEENQAHEEDDDREEYFEAPATRVDLKSHTPVIVGAIGLLLVAVIVWLFLSDDRQSLDTNAIQKFESRLTQLEEKLAKLEWLDQGLARLDKQEKDYAGLSEKIDQLDAAYKRELANIARTVKKSGQPSPAKKANKDAPKVASVKKDAGPSSKTHTVKAGETLYGIGRKYDVSLEELRKLNNLSAKSKIFPGQKLKLTP